MRQSKTILSICSGSYWKGQNEKEGGHFNLIFLIGEESINDEKHSLSHIICNNGVVLSRTLWQNQEREIA